MFLALVHRSLCQAFPLSLLHGHGSQTTWVVELGHHHGTEWGNTSLWSNILTVNTQGRMRDPWSSLADPRCWLLVEASDPTTPTCALFPQTPTGGGHASRDEDSPCFHSTSSHTNRQLLSEWEQVQAPTGASSLLGLAGKRETRCLCRLARSQNSLLSHCGIAWRVWVNTAAKLLKLFLIYRNESMLSTDLNILRSCGGYVLKNTFKQFQTIILILRQNFSLEAMCGWTGWDSVLAIRRSQGQIPESAEWLHYWVLEQGP